MSHILTLPIGWTGYEHIGNSSLSRVPHCWTLWRCTTVEVWAYVYSQTPFSDCIQMLHFHFESHFPLIYMWYCLPLMQPTSSGWGGIWSLDSPFSSGDKDLRGSTHPSPPSSQQNSSQPFMGGTYDLFENQSIWSLSSGDSSGLLSWAQDKNK